MKNLAKQFDNETLLAIGEGLNDPDGINDEVVKYYANDTLNVINRTKQKKANAKRKRRMMREVRNT